MALVLLLLVSITGHTVYSCHPQCTNDNGHHYWPAHCAPRCSRPKCEYQCQPVTAHVVIGCDGPVCQTICPQDMCESEHCPACETRCNQPLCYPKPYANCTIVCEAIQCAWECKAPAACGGNCVCERPACEALSSGGLALGAQSALLVGLSFIALLILF